MEQIQKNERLLRKALEDRIAVRFPMNSRINVYRTLWDVGYVMQEFPGKYVLLTPMEQMYPEYFQRFGYDMNKSFIN